MNSVWWRTAIPPLLALLSANVGQAQLRSLAVEMRIVSSDTSRQAELSIASHVLVAPDGHLFVFDYPGCAYGCVKYYDQNGRLVRSFGRVGEGPGELASNTELVSAAGDSVVLFDRQHGLLQVFRRSGAHVRTEKVFGIPGSRRLLGYLAGGLSLVEHNYRPARNMGFALDSALWYLQDSSGQRASVIVSDRLPSRVIQVTGLKDVPPQPFVARVHTAQEATGAGVLVVVPYSLWGGRPGQVKLVRISGNGARSEQIVAMQPRRLAPGDIEAWVAEQRKRVHERFQPAAVEAEIRKQLIISDFLPEVVEASLSTDGTVWLREFASNDWSIVSASGVVVGRVRVPADVRVVQTSGNNMWGISRDSDGLPIVSRFRILPN